MLFRSRKQMFVDSPWIDQVELDKSILELDDPSLIARLVRDPNEKLTDEAEDEQRTLPALLIGQIIPVKQGLNYQTRIGVIMAFLEESRQAGMQLSPKGGEAIVTRLDGLLQMLIEVDNNNGKALQKDVMEYLKSIGLLPAEEDADAMLAQEIAGQGAVPPEQMPPAEGMPPPPQEPTPQAPMPVEETASVGVI